MDGWSVVNQYDSFNVDGFVLVCSRYYYREDISSIRIIRRSNNMGEHIHLVGVEQVQTAANTMKSAASEMNRAANTISEVLNRHGRIMQEFLDKLNEIEQGKD